MSSTVRQILYAALTVAGLVFTWYYNLQFFQEQGGFQITEFFAAGRLNPAAISLTNDLTIAFLAFVLWVPGEARRLGIRFWGLYLVLGAVLAFAFSYPLFLLVRERKLQELDGR